MAGSPSALGRLLDPDAGHWRLGFADERGRERAYLDGTMVLASGRDPESMIRLYGDRVLPELRS